MIETTLSQTKTDAVQPVASWPWLSDLGDGTFRNPVICADYSDPDVIRHGDDYYLTASSFNCTPGLPILHSRDLVNWSIVGHALKNLPHPRYSEVQAGCGVWAPAIRFHAGKFWIFFPTPDEGIYVTTAADPRGTWSEPWLLLEGRGLIDPCPLWDDDGNAYLVHAYARSRSGICDLLRVSPMAPDASRMLGEGKVVFHYPDRHPTIEGPKFLKKDGWYYIFAPAGGVAAGWQVTLRSKSIYGPYEDRIVLEKGSTPINGPHQGAMVETPNGDWWFFHFQDAGVYGRIVHLQPVVWQDGWPMMGEDRDGNGVGEPMLRCPLPKIGNRQTPMAPQTTDEFELPQLGLQWQWHANHRDDWYSLEARTGWLRLFTQFVPESSLLKVPNVLSQKFPARSFEVETLLEFRPEKPADEAGLIITGRTCVALAVRREGEQNQIVFRENGTDHVLQTVGSEPIGFRVKIVDGGKCFFSYSIGNGEFKPIAIEFQATVGVWIGAKIGIYSIRKTPASEGFADFDYFRFSPAT